MGALSLRSTDGLDLELESEVGGGGGSCGAEPLTCGIWANSQELVSEPSQVQRIK